MKIDEAVKVLREFADLSCATDALEVEAVKVLTKFYEDYLKNRMSVEDIEEILENRILYYYQPIQAKGEIQPSLIEMRLSDYQIKKKQIKKLAEAIYKEQSRRLGI